MGSHYFFTLTCSLVLRALSAEADSGQTAWEEGVGGGKHIPGEENPPSASKPFCGSEWRHSDSVTRSSVDQIRDTGTECYRALSGSVWRHRDRVLPCPQWIKLETQGQRSREAERREECGVWRQQKNFLIAGSANTIDEVRCLARRLRDKKTKVYVCSRS
ncbi:hypothetical protein RRG08_064232 [Elysia crispata]|uniref:Secreted protein n=1 Tax=Elysia crispata TaxID=231223 RepID=A0AAE0YEA3_9GAST|nr:hypothetical protein RRG08_064232 [Elysia crispata]